ncbi:MAG: CPBP family intramembrane metalloprotease [Ignavibacteriales bacterium]|nr:CPBP family intramembrane metalloprotease [Ignavibacteriales bacterium]
MLDTSEPISFESIVEIPPSIISPKFRMSYTTYALLVLVVVFFTYQIVGGLLAVGIFGANFSENTNGVRIATMLSQFLFLLVPTLLFARYQSTDLKKFFRLNKPKGEQIVWAIIGVFSLSQALQVVVTLQEKIPLPKELQSLIDTFKQMMEEMFKSLVTAHTFPELLFVIFVVAIVPSICEEILFRGLVQQNLERGLGTKRGFIITGILFGAYHLNPFLIIPLCVLGIYFSFLVAQSGSIWVSIAAHFVNNFLAALAVYLNLGDDFLVAGKPEELSMSELFGTSVVAVIVFATSTYYFLKSTKEQIA